MLIVLLEAIMLALGGGLLGWVAGHAVVAALSPAIEAQTGVQVGFFDLAPGIEQLEFPREKPIISISPEAVLIPGLMLLAVVVGFFPAVAAYRTDVAKALTANP
jgi:putative ABC transport system permease protein